MAELLIKIGDNTNSDPEKDRLCYKDGDIVDVRTAQDIQCTWAVMLVRGTHGVKGLPFRSELYGRHFRRVGIDRINGMRITQNNPCMNFRNANLFAPRGVRYIDVPLEEIDARALQRMWEDSVECYGGALWQKLDATNTKPLVQTFPRGEHERRTFLVLFIEDDRFGNHRPWELARPLYDKKTIITKRRYRVDFREKQRDKLKLNQHVKDMPENLTRHMPDFIKKNKKTTALDAVIDAVCRYPIRYDLNLDDSIVEDKRATWRP